MAGVIQYLTWLLVAVVAVEVIAPRLGMSPPPFLNAGGLLATLAFFALGFLLYAAAFAIARRDGRRRRELLATDIGRCSSWS